jgi:hypothetical protein
MKSQNAFWSTILLLIALGIGGCSLELTQQEEPATGESREEQQKQGTAG